MAKQDPGRITDDEVWVWVSLSSSLFGGKVGRACRQGRRKVLSINFFPLLIEDISFRIAMLLHQVSHLEKLRVLK